MRSLLLVTLLSSAALTAVAADNWPQFRGPTGDGHAEATSLPTHWSETENIRWKKAIHDKGWSSPVIWGDQIWLTTAAADGKQLFALCLDRATGEIKRDMKLFDVEKPQICHVYNSYASPSPVIEKGRVYVHFGAPGTACIDTDNGKVLWDRRDLKCDHFRGAASSPILYGKLLILIFDGIDLNYVTALDKETGRTVWKTDRKIDYSSPNGDLHKAYATPSIFEIDGKAQLVCPSADATIVYDAATGEEIWRVLHNGMNAACRPIMGHGLIYLTSGHTKQLLAVKPGRGDVTAANVVWRTTKGVPSRPSMLLIDDLLYMVSDDGIASCVDAKSGERHWQERLGKAFSGSPIYADGHIYCADEEGTTHVLEPGKKFKVLEKNTLEDGCMASPVAVGKSLFVRTKKNLYCIEKR